MWTHKSGLERLPYFDDLLLPHNIDVMHTEKMSILWLNKPHKFIIVHMLTKPTHVFRVGILCTRYHHTVDYLAQTLMITT